MTSQTENTGSPADFVHSLLAGLEGVAQRLRDEGHATAEKIQTRIDEIKPMVATDIEAARTALTDLIHEVFKPLS